jgi:N-acetyl sugar amidotransferase
MGIPLTNTYRICNRCVMDTTLQDIQFDPGGICSVCRQYEERIKQELHYDEDGREKLSSMIRRIKRDGVGREYDCLIGVSGGVDSTYVAHLVKTQYGLRPLAVHLDNGWDAELAVANIEQVIKRLGIDLHTLVLDWEEFKDLQVSFLKSSIAHIEIATDHAIWATLVRTAAANRIRYIIAGTNIVTEGIAVPAWMYESKDSRLIKGIQKRFGRMKLRTYPQLSVTDFAYYLMVQGIRWIPILNYVPYSKDDAKKLLSEELGWRDYGGKHYESRFTVFEHAYWLPQKFNIDMRRPYLTAQIMSNQMTRDQALDELKSPPAPPEQMQEDFEFVMKKLNLTGREFEDIMKAPPKTYADYPNNAALWKRFSFAVKYARRRAIEAK